MTAADSHVTGLPAGSMSGKCVLVTGATGGIGFAISELLHEHGATVYLTDIDQDRGESLAGALGERARFVRLDVTEEAGWSAVAAVLEDAGLRLTTLVNCAGAALRRPLADTSLDDFRRIMELNLVGTFLGVRLAARHMVDHGAIVNIPSLNGVLPTAGLGAGAARPWRWLRPFSSSPLTRAATSRAPTLSSTAGSPPADSQDALGARNE
jgi:NAD(P)-dependent dehydrogenase (short-subunit alcohol dehydrogenase family)